MWKRSEALTDWTMASASAAEQQNRLSVTLVLVLMDRWGVGGGNNRCWLLTFTSLI